MFLHWCGYVRTRALYSSTVNAGASRVIGLIRVRFSEKMKRSPLNNAAHGGRPYGAKHTPYNWKPHESTSGRGYQPAEGSGYQRFPEQGNAEPQPCDDNFIPLNVSTPMTRHEKHNAANRYSPAGGRGSPGSGWYNNYRGNYHTPRSNCNNRYSAYKHSAKQFHGQKRRGYKGAHRQVNISAYVDMVSFLEDPWENLVEKLDDSKGTNKSEEPENESLSNSKLADNDSTTKSESKLSKDTNLNDSQCSQECKDEYSIDTSFETQNTDLSQISKINSSIESEIGDICSSQDLINESVCSISDKNYGVTQEKSDTHSNVSLTEIDQKDI